MPADSRAPGRTGTICLLAACAALAGCGSVLPVPTSEQTEIGGLLVPLRDAPVYHSAQETRVQYLEREVSRLSADLRHAEEAMVAIESGLRGGHSRADAVSELAESRIALERARRAAPWRSARIREAQSKLEEAERQFQNGHSGSAIFFSSRARRIAETLQEEAARVARAGNARFVDRPSVNLRSGPSTDEPVVLVLESDTPVFAERDQGEWVLVRTTEGPVGWIYSSLLRQR